LVFDTSKLSVFLTEIERMRTSLKWDKNEIVALFQQLLDGFDHKETGKYLDAKM